MTNKFRERGMRFNNTDGGFAFVTPEQKALLNRRISEARGWYLEEQTDMPGWFRLCRPKPSLTMFPATMFPANAFKEYAPDWTGNNDANCVLLDEMPATRMEYLPDAKVWVCAWNWLTELHDDFSEHADRRIAVCLAWCRWKSVSLEGII